MKTDYSYPYDYSNSKPLHNFVNAATEASIKIYKEACGYTLVQKNKTGQQKLRLDEIALNKMLSSLDNNGWTEVSCKYLNT